MTLFYTEKEGGQILKWPEDEPGPSIILGEDGNLWVTGLAWVPDSIYSLHWTFRWDKINGVTEGADLRHKEPQKERELPYATVVDFPARIK